MKVPVLPREANMRRGKWGFDFVRIGNPLRSAGSANRTLRFRSGACIEAKEESEMGLACGRRVAEGVLPGLQGGIVPRL